MMKRIVRPKEGYWSIRSAGREITAEEQAKLIEYFQEIRFPYRIVAGRLRIPQSVPWGEIFERLAHFYDGTAEVCPS